MARRYWICTGCHRRNLRTHIKCRTEDCARTRPKKRVPKHAVVLRDMPYDQGWPELSVEIHGGELHHCGCCGRPPIKVKRYDRDHDHRTGLPRGVACSYCNRERLRGIASAQEAKWVLDYFERVERHYADSTAQADQNQTEGEGQDEQAGGG